MTDHDLDSILGVAEQRSGGIVSDTLRIIGGVIDPARVHIGISVQTDYPLALIEREYGVPFARLRSRSDRLVCDSAQLHRSKWPLSVHQAVFQVSADTESWLSGTGEPYRVAFSTGLGNVLQNLRTVAWANGRLHQVVGEPPGHPYACLVGYEAESGADATVGMEVLLFNGDGSCARLDKRRFTAGGAGLLRGDGVERHYERKLRWAVAGYPLVLGGEAARLEETAAAVGDFRHLWRLPRLQHSVAAHLAPLSPPELQGKAEFYFAAQALRQPEVFSRAVLGLPLTLPTDLAVTDEWLSTLCDACGIVSDLSLCRAYRVALQRLEVPLGEFRADFEATGYRERPAVGDLAEGEFRIDEATREVTVRLLPAYYPQHLIGLQGSGPNLRLVNLSIAGLSGRTGITMAAARQLCQQLGLTDALIFDNGNDVVARIGTVAPVIAHAGNAREARLTAALHVAVPAARYSEPQPVSQELSLEGIDVACREFRVTE
jgi:hypothetical protein